MSRLTKLEKALQEHFINQSGKLKGHLRTCGGACDPDCEETRAALATPDYKNPLPTVDILILIPKPGLVLLESPIVLIKRKNPPIGWALPGGFIEEGETLGEAAVREAKEETGLTVELLEQFFTYSDPNRDPRRHTLSTVYLAVATAGELRGQDDAVEAREFDIEAVPKPVCFDHSQIISDFEVYRQLGERRRL